MLKNYIDFLSIIKEDFKETVDQITNKAIVKKRNGV